MAFCGNCGASLSEGVAFCRSCGKPVKTSDQAPLPDHQPTSTVAAGSTRNPGISANLASALAYSLGLITGILFLVLEPYKNDRLVRFHAMQSILFSVACVVFSIAWSIVVGILVSISGWIAFVMVPIRIVISLGIFLLWIYVIYQAYNQREYRIPFIGNIVAKQAG